MQNNVIHAFHNLNSGIDSMLITIVLFELNLVMFQMLETMGQFEHKSFLELANYFRIQEVGIF